MTILHLRTFKTQITTNPRDLVSIRLHGSVAERISHTAFNIPNLSRFLTTIPLLWIAVIQTNGWVKDVSKTLNNCLDKFLF